jgi:IclR family transcriptional regulator, KDG regulon repressor
MLLRDTSSLPGGQMAVKSIRTVANALAVVEAVADRPGAGVTALARELGIDKMAVQRILVTLAEAGWIRNSDGEAGRWELAPSLARLGRGVAADLRAVARPHLERIAADTGETVLLWLVDHRRAVVVDAVDSEQPLRMTVPVGTEVPIHNSGLGPYFDAPGQQPEFYVLYDAYPNAAAVGVPVVQYGETPTATITVVGPRSRLTRARLNAIGRDLVRVGRVLEATH